MRRISMAARDELVAAIAGRYAQGNRVERGRILDEFAAVTGFHRKHAMRLLRAGQVTRRCDPRPGRRIYAEAVREALIVIWEASDRICGKRLRQLLPILANRPARAVGQGLETVFLIALKNLVAGLARNAERATDLAHRFAVQPLSDNPQALGHYRTLLPRHPHLPRKGESCYPCVRYDLSPMSQTAQGTNRR